MAAETPDPAARFAGLEDLPVEISIRLGASRCTLSRVSSLHAGEVLSLDRKIGDPFDLRCGDVLLARVEPVAAGEGVAVKVVSIPEGDDDDL